MDYCDVTTPYVIHTIAESIDKSVREMKSNLSNITRLVNYLSLPADQTLLTAAS